MHTMHSLFGARLTFCRQMSFSDQNIKMPFCPDRNDLDADLDLNGFGMCFDRALAVKGKNHWVFGLRLFVNKNWCNTMVVRKSLCSPDIELLSVLLSSFISQGKSSTICHPRVYISIDCQCGYSDKDDLDWIVYTL